MNQEDGRAAKDLESTQVLLGEANSEMDNLSYRHNGRAYAIKVRRHRLRHGI
ncbi:hypothetical protein CROQUDRAFT_100575 [Cronartium quercuum f. sp. fusiforme G11]|uniref:Uncharacterized protein n=1 Tax=Cronartium quercuum f. sp. fusiforme G11 TaxID=708437 RepID=A0A9P6N612_9BASI|nr:hypothetical protein CROQUDRAFT_100575 [Cronartium quercuum f. sp. fusiforme G11]